MGLLNELKKERDILQSKIDAINTVIKSYEASESKSDSNPSSIKQEIFGFPESGSYLEKIIFIIKDSNRFLHNNEIAETLSVYDKRNIADIKRRVSTVLSQAKSQVDTLVNVKYGKSIKNTFWGSKDWLDTNGKIKEKHMYRLDIIGGEHKKITL